MLDEAFSKSFHAVAGVHFGAERAGPHPLFVTPNKEMRLLRAHTRSASGTPQRPAATLTLSWEELEAHAEKMTRKAHEVPG